MNYGNIHMLGLISNGRAAWNVLAFYLMSLLFAQETKNIKFGYVGFPSPVEKALKSFQLLDTQSS